MPAKANEFFVSQALEGFLLAKAAEGRSPKTIRDYTYCLKMPMQWLEDKGDTPLSSLTTNDLRRFLAELRTHRERPLSPKTIRNVYLAMSSFWSWICQEFDAPNLMANVAAPKANPPAPRLPTQDQVGALLRACDYSNEVEPGNRASFRMKRPTALRDRAILLVLLDTGLRAQELCSLTLDDIDLKTGSMLVRKGKGSKQRIVYCGKAARKVLWRYISMHRQGAAPDDPLFVSKDGRDALTVNGLSHLVHKLGDKAGVDVWPHLLRHVFATEFLRGGGNLLALKRLLGHASMGLLERYTEIAQADLQAQHASASPADRWRL